ncbi:MAG: hypothetical protein IJT23_09345 [Clostridia bacterium]|nr:hypothetical protein [Clostridia bacterium]
MKKRLSVFTVLTMICALFTALPASAELSTTEIGGKTYYEIATAEDYAEFVTMANANLTINAVLTADIDLDGQTVVQIGKYANARADSLRYSGTFDGNGHVIRNLSISRTFSAVADNGFAMFSATDGAVIKNLGLENAKIENKGAKDGVVMAVIVGAAYATTIENCYVKNSSVLSTKPNNYINYAAPIGGFLNGESKVINCYSTDNTVGFSTSGGTASGGNSISCFVGCVSSSGGSASNIQNSYARDNTLLNAPSGQKKTGFARLGTSGNTTTAWLNSYTDKKTGFDAGTSMNYYETDAPEWSDGTVLDGINGDNVFKADTYGLNGGAPRLFWEAEPQSEGEGKIAYDFEEPFNLYSNDFIINESGGNIRTSSYIEHNCLEVKAKNNGYYHTVTRNFRTVKNGKLEVDVDILFKSVKTENGFISIGTDDADVLKLGVQKGNLVYLSEDNTYKIIKKNIARNKWYTISINLDFDRGMWSLVFDGEDIGATIELLGAECSNICFYTKYSPGFCIDDLRIDTLKDKVPEINGADSISYTVGTTQAYIYSSNQPVTWSVTGDVSGVTAMTLPNGNLELRLAQDMSCGGMVSLNAQNSNGDTSRIDILISEAQISDIVIKGSNRVTYGKGTFTYSAYAHDKFGNTITAPSVTWTVSGSDKVSVLNGVLTVGSAFTADTPIKITASAFGMTGTKNIVGQDVSVYNADMTRWNRLISAVDTALLRGRDIYGSTPLMASGYDVSTGRPTEFHTSKGSYAPANLGMDSVFFRMLDRLSQVSGHEKYSDRVDKIYAWYMENGLDEATKLGYWGGHTFIDLKTGSVYMAKGNTYTHELKNTCLYFEPFYRLDKKKASEMFKSIWGGHVGREDRWAELRINRHAPFDSASVNGVIKSIQAMDNLDAFTGDNAGWLSYNNGIPFRADGEDLVILATQEYEKTGNDVALIWANRLLNMYYNCRNADTGIVPTEFSNAKNAPGKQSIIATYGSEWWKMIASNGSEWTNPVFGDRFFNQFGEDLVDQGFYDSSALDDNDTRILEGNFFENSDNIELVTINDLAVASSVGLDSAYGKAIKNIAVKNIAGYIKYAWNEGTPNFNKIMADGTSLTGFVPKRNGHYGNYYTNGSNGFKTFVPDADISDRGLFEAVACAYLYCANDTALADEAELLNRYLQYHMERYGIIADNAVSASTSERTPAMLNALIYLYKATDNAAYLELARKTADNMISFYCQKGVFSSRVDSSSSRYRHIELGGRSTKFYDALLNLECSICGMEDIPANMKFSGFFEDYFINSSTGAESRTWDSTVYAITY